MAINFFGTQPPNLIPANNISGYTLLLSIA